MPLPGDRRGFEGRAASGGDGSNGGRPLAGFAGLAAGDHLIIEGLGHIQPGQTVKAVRSCPAAATLPAACSANRMISRTFIDRPVLAWVISILIMLGGLGGIPLLPVEQYPDIAPPSVNVRASYPGRVGRDA